MIKCEYIEDNYNLLKEDELFFEIINKLNLLTFDDYCFYLKYCYENRYNLKESENEIYNFLNKEVLCEDGVFTFYFDVREIIVLFAHLLTGEERLIQDLTEVTHAGYYKLGSNVIKECEKIILNSSKSSEQTYIFTEGPSDRFILQESLKILYPHLYDFFEFVNYEISNLDGGAHILAKLIKGFVGAKMPNKILAIFDSDTIAIESINTLKKVSLPDNIKVTQYPNFELLTNYPTLGPNGYASQNIFNQAASIELYLGKDCITDHASSEYYPVIWKSYNEHLNQYQGEISNKRKIFENFREKIKLNDHNNLSIDWYGLRCIWEHIFKLIGEIK